MAWDPGQYLKFADHRLRPAIDLLNRIDAAEPAEVVDLGAGAGNVTRLLKLRWPGARITGVDASKEMLEKAAAAAPEIAWQLADLGTWRPGRPVDIIYSNAALHWLEGHDKLFPALFSSLAPGGVLAVQMPRNFSAPSHTSMAEAARGGPWRAKLDPLLRPSPTGDPAIYYDLLASRAAALDIWETEYLQVLEGENPVKEWTKGTWLKPLLDALAFLERAGHAAEALDISVEPFESGRFVRARFVAISVPMHTALRLGVRVAEQIRRVNPGCHICFYGLYASLNADYLLEHCGDSAIGGEYEAALVALVESLEAGYSGPLEGVQQRRHAAGPVLQRLPFAVPSRGALPGLKKYAHLDKGGSKELVGYVEASRGCLHLCLHCPIPPVYGGRFFVVPQDIVLDDIRRLARDGATHITFGDPDFLNGPGHSLAIVRAMHGELPSMTFDFTAKVEHILELAGMFPELNRLGCVFMVSAVESLSDTVLANLEKGHTRADVTRALQIG